VTNKNTATTKTHRNHNKILQDVLNNVDGFIYAKNLQGEYTYVNQAVLELFNKNLSEVLGFDDSHFFDLALSKQLKKNDQEVMSKGIVVESEETNFIKATGETRIYKSIKKPLFDDQEIVIGMCGISTDITDDKALKNTVKEQKHLLKTILNNIDAHIYMKDSQRNFLYVNNKVAELFGYPAENIIGKRDTDILAENIAEHFHQSDKKVFENNEKQVIEESVEDEQGNSHHYISTKIPYNQPGKPSALIGFSIEVTELYQLKEEFRKQANSDSLTGLYNRRYFVEQAEREFNRAKRHTLPLSLLSIDIDHFKEINDQYGHPVGDQVLVSVAKSLLPMLRKEDILARMGGEEFSILLPETSIQAATLIAERVRLQQSKICLTGDWAGEIRITVSIGISSMKAKEKSFDALFSRTDQALYQAKNTGRNKVVGVE